MRKGSISGEEGHLAPSRGSERLAFRVESVLLCPEVLSSFPAHRKQPQTPVHEADPSPAPRAPHGTAATRVLRPGLSLPVALVERSRTPRLRAAPADRPSPSAGTEPPRGPPTVPAGGIPADLGLSVNQRRSPAKAGGNGEDKARSHHQEISNAPRTERSRTPGQRPKQQLAGPVRKRLGYEKDVSEEAENTAQGTGRPSHDPQWGCARTGATGLGQPDRAADDRLLREADDR